MDTTKTPVKKSPEEVEAVIGIIKTKMPETYKSIQETAQRLGKPAYALVRAGVRGEPNCFYACERGHVVGTPFNDDRITRDIAWLMVTMGVEFFFVWPDHAGQQKIKEAA